MDNMDIYESFRAVPQEAQKEIKGGRLKGMTDINPMWRIKCLTQKFGPCGIGWKYEITKQWLEPGANGEISAFCNINLYIKVAGEWSEPILGTGGSSFVAKETNGLRTSDECYKMALTDAISVACKALGIGADVYWKYDRTKYSNSTVNDAKSSEKSYVCADCGRPFVDCTAKDGRVYTAGQIYHMAQKKSADGIARCSACRKKVVASA